MSGETHATEDWFMRMIHCGVILIASHVKEKSKVTVLGLTQDSLLRTLYWELNQNKGAYGSVFLRDGIGPRERKVPIGLNWWFGHVMETTQSGALFHPQT